MNSDVEKNYLQSIKIMNVPLCQQKNHLDKDELNFSFKNTNTNRCTGVQIATLLYTIYFY